MEKTVNIELVRFAVQRVITCRSCGDILDLDSAVLVERGAHSTVICGTCWQGTKARLAEGVEVHVISGRTGESHLFTGIAGTSLANVSHEEPTKSEADISGEQSELF